MTTYFVTRHKGAVEWARQRGISARHVTHLDAASIQPGDQVFGTLPVSEAAKVCANGGRYFHLALDMPPHARGQELSPKDMSAYGAQLIEYEVKEKPNAK